MHRAALKAAGYHGYYDVELIGEDIDRRDYRELLAEAKAAYCRLVGRVKNKGATGGREADTGTALHTGVSRVTRGIPH